ncbi:MAG: hypothetical protein GY941_05105 [Planctomycetes bacterium]|nr:hypothetical protein [Planctomycetota bacterium]
MHRHTYRWIEWSHAQNNNTGDGWHWKDMAGTRMGMSNCVFSVFNKHNEYTALDLDTAPMTHASISNQSRKLWTNTNDK